MEGEPQSIYAPFVRLALDLFDEAGLGLQNYPLDDGLLRREGSSGKGSHEQHVSLRARAYCSEEVRQTRMVHIAGGSALQVLNFCIFPSLRYALPTFAADLVTLPGGHLIALDFAPNGDAALDAAYANDGALAAAFARHRDRLPDGGSIPEDATRFFSPYFLWSRLPVGPDGDAIVSSDVLAAFEDYLRAYLQLVNAAEPLESAQARDGVRAAQLAYATYRAESDPARPMLTRLFGGEYSERLIHEVLFDLPRVLEAKKAS